MKDLKQFLGNGLIEFQVGQIVFDVVYGTGEVLNTDPECEGDSYPVQVLFKKDTQAEHVEFYDHNGEEMGLGQRTLFASKAAAIEHLQVAV